jgi:signal transduction histidine kinase
MRFGFKRGVCIGAFFFCLLAVCTGMLCVRNGHAADAKKVLVVFPEDAWSAPAYQTIYDAIKSVFDADDRMRVTLFGECLDLYLFPGVDRERSLVAFLQKKYAGVKFDLLIPVANSSLDFIMRHRDSLFPGTPIVYCKGVAVGGKGLEHGSDTTGTAVTCDIAGTIELARALRPGLKRIAVIAGTGLVDKFLLSTFYAAFKDYQGKMELIDLAGLPMDALLTRVSGLPEATAIFYLSLSRDGAGRIFSSAATQKLVSQAANAPLFNLIDTALGYGSVGGRMTQLEAMGRKSAQIARRVLSGTSAAAIPPEVISYNPAMLDGRELKRWGIDESLLPAGSIVRFRETSLWEIYRWWVIGTFTFICLQTLMIAVLVNALLKRKQADAQASRFHQQLAHMSRVATVGQLGQSLAHEINQPLAAIQLNAEAAQKLLEETHPDLAEARAALGDIVADNKRAQEVILGVRHLVKNIPPTPTRIGLNQVATDAVQMMRADAAAKGVSVHLQLEAGLPAVVGDSVQLQQVVLNLLLNAVEAVSQNPSPPRLVTVRTAAEAEGRTVSLSVADNGPGIDPKTAERLFEAFFSTKPHGLGLGLSICRSIAEAHGGALSYPSAPGKGAEFRLRLPAGAAEKERHSPGGPNHGG